MTWREYRCPECGKLLFKYHGQMAEGGAIEVQCRDRDCRAFDYWTGTETEETEGQTRVGASNIAGNVRV